MRAWVATLCILGIAGCPWPSAWAQSAPEPWVAHDSIGADPTVVDALDLLFALAASDDEDGFRSRFSTATIERLEAEWNEFAAKAKLEQSAEEIGQALGTVGEELKKGYERLKKAL